MKLNFNHEANSLNVALGVSDKRAVKLDSLIIFESVQVYLRKNILFKDVPNEDVPLEFGTLSSIIENIVNKLTDDAEIAVVLLKVTSINRLIRKTRMDILKLKMFLDKEKESDEFSFKMGLTEEAQLRYSLLGLESFLKICKAAEASNDDAETFHELLKAEVTDKGLYDLFKRVGELSKEAEEKEDEDEEEED